MIYMEELSKDKKHILIIDDDPAMRRLFGGRLANKGFEILYAKDGAEGREMARRMQPDIILLDLQMPVMDGMEAGKRMKEEQLTKNIPIILLTNGDLPTEGEQWIKDFGIEQYVQKGVDFEILLEHIQRLLKK